MVEDGVAVIVYTFLAVTLRQFLPQCITNGNDECGTSCTFVKWMIHTSELVLDFCQQINGYILQLFQLRLGEIIL